MSQITPPCDDEAYELLKRYSDRRDMTEWNEWRKKNQRKDIYLQDAKLYEGYCQHADFSKVHFEGAHFREADCAEADFTDAHCERADFKGTHCRETNFTGARCEEAIFSWARCEEAKFLRTCCEGAHFNEADFEGAHCEEADFRWARCENAKFRWAHCEEADFTGANCEGTDFWQAHCEGAIFSDVTVDGKSTFIACTMDGDTDFRLTNLGNVKIEPGKKALLERNIRRLNWESWYKKTLTGWRKLSPWAWLSVGVARLFWKISDYGYSTGRVLGTFLACVVLFAFVYTLFLGMLTPIQHFPQTLFFAAATMVTPGFANINAASGSLWSMLVVLSNLLIGYFILAVLVTRLAVLFQTMAPGDVVPKKTRLTDDSQNRD